MIHNDMLLILLIFEWWIGTQKWINAKSTIELIILVLGLGFYFIKHKAKGK